MNLHELSLLAHAGHPAPADHGLLSHLLVGAFIALPFVLGSVLWIRNRHKSSSAARQPVQKD